VSEKMFSREQYEQLRSFPEISRDELFRYLKHGIPLRRHHDELRLQHDQRITHSIQRPGRSQATIIPA
jgi:hypothetical protein